LSAKGTSTGVTAITGLPFTIADSLAGTSIESSGVVGYFTDMAAIDNIPQVIAKDGATTLSIYDSTASDSGEVTEANLTDTSSLRVSISYFTG